MKPKINRLYRNLLNDLSSIEKENYKVFIESKFSMICSSLAVQYGIIYENDFYRNQYIAYCFSENTKLENVNKSGFINNLPDDYLERLTNNEYVVQDNLDQLGLFVYDPSVEVGITFPICFQGECNGFIYLAWNRQIELDEEKIEYYKDALNLISILYNIVFLLWKLDELDKENNDLVKKNTAFFENFTHELKTPLYGISASLENLKTIDLDSTVSKQLGIIDLSYNKLNNDINNILEFSKDTFLLESNSEMVYLEEEIKRTIDSYKYFSHSFGVNLNLDFDYRIPNRVYIDKEKVLKVINDLLEGAIRGANGKDVQFRVYIRDVTYPYVEIGFSISYEGALFISNEDYEQYYETDSKNDQVVKDSTHRYLQDIVNILHGNLYIVQDNDIAEYVFSLKMYVNKRRSFSKPFKFEQHKLDTSKVKPKVEEEYILIVDDNRINRRVIRTLLQRKGIESLEASNGYDAISMAKDHTFTMILMDILMPGMNGYETTRKIRALNNHNSNIPIIAVTAHDDQEAKSQVFDAGMNGYIIKPLTNESFEDIVLKYIKHKDKEPQEVKGTTAIFNIAAFKESYEDISFQMEIIETFMNEYQDGFDSIKKGFKNQSIEEIYRSLLYYKGSFGALKADKITQLTEDIIKQTKELPFEKLKDSESVILSELEALHNELQKYLKELKNIGA